MKVRLLVVKEKNGFIFRIVQSIFEDKLSMVTKYTTVLLMEVNLLDKQFFVCNVRCS
jgi:hypothetical protein